MPIEKYRVESDIPVVKWLISYQPEIQRQMAERLTRSKHDHITTDNRTLTVNADPSEPEGRARGAERSKALQPDREKLSYPTQYHHTAHHQVDKSAEKEIRLAFIAPSTRRMAQDMRIHPCGRPAWTEARPRTKRWKNPLDGHQQRCVRR